MTQMKQAADDADDTDAFWILLNAYPLTMTTAPSTMKRESAPSGSSAAYLICDADDTDTFWILLNAYPLTMITAPSTMKRESASSASSAVTLSVTICGLP